MSDIDQRLREYAQQWRAIQSAPAISSAAIEPRRRRSRQPLGRSLPRWTLPGLVVAAAVGAVALVISNTGSGQKVVTRPASPTPPASLAAPPLLRVLPAPTPPVRLITGVASGTRWEFWAKMSPLTGKPAHVAGSPKLSFDPGLSLELNVPSGPAFTYGDPRTQFSNLNFEAYGPLPGFSAEVIMGVTSVPAARVVVSFAGGLPPATVSTINNPYFPGLRFFALSVSPSVGGNVEIEALAVDGTPLVHTDPSLLGPPHIPANVSSAISGSRH